MEAECKCGAVRFCTGLSSPLALYICHCSKCRRQASAQYGTNAIFPTFPLPKVEKLACYERLTVTGHLLHCYFCQDCGTRLLYATPNKNVVSVKGGCLRGLDWGRAIHIWTDSALIPIPEGVENFPADPPVNSYGRKTEKLDQPEYLISEFQPGKTESEEDNEEEH